MVDNLSSVFSSNTVGSVRRMAAYDDGPLHDLTRHFIQDGADAIGLVPGWNDQRYNRI
jgi:hypothetical protein